MVTAQSSACGAVCTTLSESIQQEKYINGAGNSIYYTDNTYLGTTPDDNTKEVAIRVIMGDIDGTIIGFPYGAPRTKILMDPSIKPGTTSSDIQVNKGFAWVSVRKNGQAAKCITPFVGQRWRHVATRTIAGGAQGTQFIFACVPDASGAVLFDRLFLIDPAGNDHVRVGWHDSCAWGKGLVGESWLEATNAPSISAPKPISDSADCKFVKDVVNFVNTIDSVNKPAQMPTSANCK